MCGHSVTAPPVWAYASIPARVRRSFGLELPAQCRFYEIGDRPIIAGSAESHLG